MLAGASRQELGDRRVVRVAFQHCRGSPFDDLQVLAAREDEDRASLEVWVAVRRKTKFTKSDEDTGKLIGALIEAAGMPESLGRERVLVLCAAAGHNATNEVAELARLARARASEESFRAEVAESGRARSTLRGRFRHLEDLVRRSGPEGHGLSAWELLRLLHVSQLRVEGSEEGDWSALQDELRSWAHERTLTGAMGLRSRLAELAGQYAPDGAEVDRSRLCRDTHSLLHSDRRLLEEAWGELRRLQQDARDAVRSGCGIESPVTLPRAETRDDLADALLSTEALVVSGESGVGKSALVCSALDRLAAQDGDFQSVYLNLRHLPPRPSDLRSSLGAPLDRVLGEMSAPKRLLVIDAADQCAETQNTPLAAILGDASRAGVAVCAVSAETGMSAVESVVASAVPGALHRFAVTGLSDAEVIELAGHFPSLGQVSGDSRARELLRRPVVADLLARAGGGGVPLSMGAAMEEIWAGLVRGEGRPGGGSPDSREQTMRGLAHWHLSGEDPEQAFAEIDGEVLECLRRDGIVRAGSKPWSPMPEFSHDILRAFAVARVLAAGGDPAGRLLGFGAPRWALPAARMALQSLLHGGDQSGATLESLQDSCDALVASGKGARWGDIAVEAALELPDWDDILAESWEWLAADGGGGLSRVFRLVAHRHTDSLRSDPLVAGPIAGLLVERCWPGELQTQVETFLQAWLRGLISHWVPAGNKARTGLRAMIEHRVALGDLRECEQEQERAARLATRTAEQAEEQEARIRIGLVHSALEGRRPQRGSLPFELTSEVTLQLLVLLGPDLGEAGEGLLRRVAAADPERLQEALEALLAGEALAQFDHGLLVDLVEAYYIEEDQSLHDSFASRDGIRRHAYAGFGVPQAGPWRGPFYSMLRNDFPAGVACLNRILNHAARSQMRPSRSGLRGGAIPDDADPSGEVLSISGEPRKYAGNAATWLWYRVIGTGAYPCTSALQALERACDQILEGRQLPPQMLLDVLLDGCENLAVPALAFGLAVRHIERFDCLVDPFLVEPFVWEADARRAGQEDPKPAGESPGVAFAERREWEPLMFVMSLVLVAGEDRRRELKELGSAFFERAEASLDGHPRQAEELAIARRRAMAFDIEQYESEVVESGDAISIGLREDEEVQAALAESNADLLRSTEAISLQLRYAARPGSTPNAEPVDDEQLKRDITTAKNLLADPPPRGAFGSDGAPAAVAAAVLEGFFLGESALETEDLAWAARTLAGVAQAHEQQSAGESQDLSYYEAIFWMGADRSAARGLPLLLRPDARTLLDRLAADGLDQDGFRLILLWLFTGSPNETRNAASRALDSVWRSSCSVESGKCFHQTALDLVEQSARHSTAPWRHHDDDQEPGPLDGPILDALESANNLVICWLNPALRALGALALTPTACVREQAAEMLDAVLEAHRRTRSALEIGFHHSDRDALFAARAALACAAAGHPTALQDHVRGFAANSDALSECLMALAAAAEESPEAATAAREAWPQLMRDGLRLLSENAADEQQRDRLGNRARAFSAILPARAIKEMYAYREIPDGPNTWIDPETWKPEIDLWVQTAVESRTAANSAALPAGGLFGTIGAMVSMLHSLPTEHQARTGIHWIEQLVASAGSEAANTFALPEWLQDVRPHCRDEELDSWQRIADLLYVHGDPRASDIAD
ncbi:hypothetical protein [Candidatus Poriferisocius sp.]|uniref:hypothetical protein n=1 Tax=Candidatus Poriferisocius sp. TaxID=3101276 RepID=UPI003B02D5AB